MVGPFSNNKKGERRRRGGEERAGGWLKEKSFKRKKPAFIPNYIISKSHVFPGAQRFLIDVCIFFPWDP